MEPTPFADFAAALGALCGGGAAFLAGWDKWGPRRGKPAPDADRGAVDQLRREFEAHLADEKHALEKLDEKLDGLAFQVGVLIGRGGRGADIDEPHSGTHRTPKR